MKCGYERSKSKAKTSLGPDTESHGSNSIAINIYDFERYSGWYVAGKRDGKRSSANILSGHEEPFNDLEL